MSSDNDTYAVCVDGTDADARTANILDEWGVVWQMPPVPCSAQDIAKAFKRPALMTAAKVLGLTDVRHNALKADVAAALVQAVADDSPIDFELKEGA